MNNEIIELANTEKVHAVQTLIRQDKIETQDITKIVELLDNTPTIINHLTLDDVSKLSIFGVDLSKYITAVHINNIKVFVVKFASDSMMRVSKLIDVLNKVEEKYYMSTLNNSHIHPRVAADMIDRIQESITASVNLMMKLTDNETLMNLFIVNMNSITDTITENKGKGYTSSVQILPLESRKKLDKVVTLFAAALNDVSEPDTSKAVDAEYTEKG